MVKKALSLTGWKIIYCPFQFLAVVGGESAQAELASTEVVNYVIIFDNIWWLLVNYVIIFGDYH